MAFYEVMCWGNKAQYWRAEGDYGSQRFYTLKEAKMIATRVEKDSSRQKPVTCIEIYEVKLVKRLEFPHESTKR